MIRNFQPLTQHTLLLCKSTFRLQAFGLIRPDLFQRIISRYQYGVALNSSGFPLIWFQRQKRQVSSTVLSHGAQLYFNFSFLLNLITSPQSGKPIQTRQSQTFSFPFAMPSLIPQARSFRLNQFNSPSLVSDFNLRLLQPKVPVQTFLTPAIASDKVFPSGLLIDHHLIRRIFGRSQSTRLSVPRPFSVVPQGFPFILAPGAATISDGSPFQKVRTNRQRSLQPRMAPATSDGLDPTLPISARMGNSVLPLTQRRSRRISPQLLTRQPSLSAATGDFSVMGIQPQVGELPPSAPAKPTVWRTATKPAISSSPLDQPAELSYSHLDVPIKQAINSLKANLAELQTQSAQQMNALAKASWQPSQASHYELPATEVNRIADQVYNALERNLRTERERRGR
jgi:hypothetical protein